MTNQQNFLKTSDTYNEGILLDIYQNEYGLCVAEEGSDGNIYKKWIFPQTKGREPGPKAIPWKITLGVRQQAIQRLEQLIMMIEQTK
jgi:hypothetical protein